MKAEITLKNGQVVTLTSEASFMVREEEGRFIVEPKLPLQSWEEYCELFPVSCGECSINSQGYITTIWVKSYRNYG